MAGAGEGIRRSSPWSVRSAAGTARPRPPAGVAIATVVLLVLAALGLVQSVILLLGGVAAMTEEGESPGLVLALGGGSVATSLFYLLLAVKTWRGRRWAWLTTLVLLGAMALLGLGVLLSGGTTGEGLAGLVFAVPAVLLMALLAGPRSSREHYRRR